MGRMALNFWSTPAHAILTMLAGSVDEPNLVRQQEPAYAVDQVAQDLEHPVFVGLLDDARNLYSPALEVHHDERAARDGALISLDPPHLGPCLNGI